MDGRLDRRNEAMAVLFTNCRKETRKMNTKVSKPWRLSSPLFGNCLECKQSYCVQQLFDHFTNQIN